MKKYDVCLTCDKFWDFCECELYGDKSIKGIRQSKQSNLWIEIENEENYSINEIEEYMKGKRQCLWCLFNIWDFCECELYGDKSIKGVRQC